MAREELITIGRHIGTYDGWDEGDSDVMIFYAFKPCDVLASELPEGDLNVDFTKGEFTYYEDDGSLYKKYDMLPILQMVKKVETV